LLPLCPAHYFPHEIREGLATKKSGFATYLCNLGNLKTETEISIVLGSRRGSGVRRKESKPYDLGFAPHLSQKRLSTVTAELQNLVLTLEKRVATLEGKPGAGHAKPVAAAADDDDDIDLFGSSDDEDAEAARVTS
jgi:hypothetical protein